MPDLNPTNTFNIEDFKRFLAPDCARATHVYIPELGLIETASDEYANWVKALKWHKDEVTLPRQPGKDDDVSVVGEGKSATVEEPNA